MEFLYEIIGRFGSSSSGQQVVVNQHHVVFRDGIFVYFDGVRAVLFGKRFLDGFGWKFARFACRDKARSQSRCQ